MVTLICPAHSKPSPQSHFTMCSYCVCSSLWWRDASKRLLFIQPYLLRRQGVKQTTGIRTSF
jgi:hypothetical protein